MSADNMVSEVGRIMLSAGIERRMTAYGVSAGWRRQQLRTNTGFNVAAYGLDTALRGIKIDQYRPDLIIFDDIDSIDDSEDATRKIMDRIAADILAAGSQDMVCLVVQNKITAHGVMAQLLDGRAKILINREPSEPIPACTELVTKEETLPNGSLRTVVVSCRPSWSPMGVKGIQKLIDDLTFKVFKRECQHEVEEAPDGALWTVSDFNWDGFRLPPAIIKRGLRWEVNLPTGADRAILAIDPAIRDPETAKRTPDHCGIFVMGVCDGLLHVYHDFSILGSPEEWAKVAIGAMKLYDCDYVAYEDNQGGDLVRAVLRQHDRKLKYKSVRAFKGKRVRAEAVVAAYNLRRVRHHGDQSKLEHEQTHWDPGDKTKRSPNRIDAIVVGANALGFALSRGVSVTRRMSATNKPESSEKSKENQIYQ